MMPTGNDSDSDALSDLSCDIDDLLDTYANKPHDHPDKVPGSPRERTSGETGLRHLPNRTSTLSERRSARLFIKTPGTKPVPSPPVTSPPMPPTPVMCSPRRAKDPVMRDSLSPEPLAWQKRCGPDSSDGIRASPIASETAVNRSSSRASPKASPSGYGSVSTHSPTTIPSLASPPAHRDSGLSALTTGTSIISPKSTPPQMASLADFGRFTPPTPMSPLRSRISRQERGRYLRAMRVEASEQALPSFPHNFRVENTVHKAYREKEEDVLVLDDFVGSTFGYDLHPFPSVSNLAPSPEPIDEEDTPWRTFSDAPSLTRRVRSASAEGEMQGHTYYDGVEADEDKEPSYVYARTGYESSAVQEGERMLEEEDEQMRRPFILSPASAATTPPVVAEEEVSVVAEPRDRQGPVERALAKMLAGRESYRVVGPLRLPLGFFSVNNVNMERQLEFELAWNKLHGVGFAGDGTC